MKKILLIFILLFSLISCNKVYNKLNIYIEMEKNELLENSLISKENIYDLYNIVLIKYEKNIYIIKFDNNKVFSYEIYKEKNNVDNKRKEYFNDVYKIELADAVKDFGFPESASYSDREILSYRLCFNIELVEKEKNGHFYYFCHGITPIMSLFYHIGSLL